MTSKATSTPERERDIVLVVDDSPDTLRMLTDAIELGGATVLVALDGAQALGIAEAITPDIVLMDAVMPGMDGFETTRRLKADAALRHVPVIFMTGSRKRNMSCAGWKRAVSITSPSPSCRTSF